MERESGHRPAAGDGRVERRASTGVASGGDGRLEARRELFGLIRRFRHERYDMRPLLTAELGMTAAEAHVLAHLLRAEDEGRDARPSDIAHLGRVTPSAVSQTLKVLEGKGAIVRKRCARDSRVVTLRLTEEGRRLAAELFERRAKMLDDLVAYVGEEELLLFVSTLSRIMEFCDERLGGVSGEPAPCGDGKDVGRCTAAALDDEDGESCA